VSGGCISCPLFLLKALTACQSSITVSVWYLYNFFDEVTDEPDNDDPLADSDRRHGSVRRQFSQHEVRQHGKESQVRRLHTYLPHKSYDVLWQQYVCLHRPLINQWIDESINQSINQSIDQSIDQSIYQWINRLINRLIDESINQSIDRSIDQSSNQSMNQSSNQSINQSIDNRSTDRSIDRLINQSINPSIHPSVHSSIHPFIHYFILFYLFIDLYTIWEYSEWANIRQGWP